MIKLGDIDSKDSKEAGESILIYGPTGSGKTGAALTCPDPILHINTEGKDARPVHRDIIRYMKEKGKEFNKKITYVKFDSTDDEKEHLNKWLLEIPEGNFPFKTIFYDGITFSQQEKKHELEVSRSDIRKGTIDSKGRSDWRGLVDDFRFEKPDWGAMGSAMSRTTNLLVQFTAYDIVVVCTALEDTNYPKWGQGLRIGPALVGQDYSKLLAGFFHYIGYVIRPFKIIDGEIQLPLISFKSNTSEAGNDYLARSSSIALTNKDPAPLDFEKILKVIRG